jgi:hypothetical protein
MITVVPHSVEKLDAEAFDSITEAEIISLWESFKSLGLSEEAAWNAILAGIALDMAFARTKNLPRLEQ